MGDLDQMKEQPKRMSVSKNCSLGEGGNSMMKGGLKIGMRNLLLEIYQDSMVHERERQSEGRYQNDAMWLWTL